MSHESDDADLVEANEDVEEASEAEGQPIADEDEALEVQDNPHTHTIDDAEVSFTAWTEADSLPTSAGNYYLASDVTISATWSTPSGKTNLCLDGHTISLSGTGSVINITNGSTLAVYDCESTGSAGSITGGNNSGNGGGVNVAAGTFELHGGSIEGNVAGNGAGVSVSNSGTFRMSGGAIQYNAGYGNTGGVLVVNNNFTMSGGAIQYNAGKNFGGIGIAGAQPNISGTAKVAGNVMFSDMSASNLKISKADGGFTLTQGGTPCDVKHASGNGLKIKVVGPLQDGAQIGIFNNSQTDAFTNGYSTNNPDDDPSAYFFRNDGLNDGVALNASKEAMLAKYYNVTWRDWDGTVLETDEHILIGTMPTYDGVAPTRDEDERYTYTFNGWSPSVTAVKSDVTYTAAYDVVVKSVTYREAAWDGNSHKVVYTDVIVENAIGLTANTTAWEGGKTYVAFDDVTINARIAFSGDVKLVLCDGATLTCNGMSVKPSDSLAIYAQEAGTGKLNANGGIGGISNNGAQTVDNNAGDIAIHGGVINASGWNWGAGIGGGVYGAAGTVDIYGGKITATGGGSGGAGIGGGVGSSKAMKQDSYVNIYGGNVVATGRGGGAGIGGGGKWHTTCDGATVKILGGCVLASGQVGIGAGKNNSNHKALEIGDHVAVYDRNVYDYTADASVQPYAVGPAENVETRYTTMKVVYCGYTVSVDEGISSGIVSVDKLVAGEGETVTLTTTPDESYVLNTCTAKDAEGKEIQISGNQFVMPASSVTISATFAPIVYDVRIEAPEHGTVTADPAAAEKNMLVSVTAKPEAGYALDKIQAFKAGTDVQQVTLTALSGDQTGGEGFAKLVDRNTKTKWGLVAGTGHIIVKANKPFVLKGFGLTTANDTARYSGRNWRNWEIYGANFASDSEAVRNAAEWQLVASVMNDTKLDAANYTTYDYAVDTVRDEYQYYKVEILANKAGSGMSQMAELTMKGVNLDAEVTLTQDSADDTLYTFDMPASNVAVRSEWKVSPATAPTITAHPDDLELAYGYTEGSIRVVASAADDAAYELTYQWYSCQDKDGAEAVAISEATSPTYAIPVGKSAGTTEYYYCVVTATRQDNGQTVEVSSDVATVTVGKASAPQDSDLTDGQKPTANTLVYTAESQVLVAAPTSLVDGYTKVQYSLDGGKTWADEVPTGIDAGDYTIKVKYVGDDNHTTFVGADLTATIKQRPVTVSAMPQTVLVNGEIQTGLDMASLSGAINGHVLSDVALASGSTATATSQGKITPRDAAISDGEVDVTKNYDIAYTTGRMIVQGKVHYIKQNMNGTWPQSADGVESETRPGEGTTFNPTKTYEHYTISGWSSEYLTSEDGRNPAYPGAVINVGEGVNDLCVYYSVSTYSLVFYEDQEGQTIWRTESVRYGMELSGYAPTVDDTGTWTGEFQLSDRNSELFTFGGWATEAGVTVWSSDGKTVTDKAFDWTQSMPAQDLNVYPVWVANYINVRLDLGAYDAVAVADVAAGRNNWYDASRYDENTPATMGSPTWGDADYQGRSFWKSTNITAASSDYDKYVNMTIMNQAERAGYVLDGWYTSNGMKWQPTYLIAREYGDKDASGNLILTYDAPYRNYTYVLTLTARWTLNAASVTYDVGEGSGSVTDSSIYPIDSVITIQANEPTPPQNEENTRYVFKGWRDGRGDLHQPGATITYTDESLVATYGTTNEIKLTAEYQGIPTSSLVFDSQGGSLINPIVRDVGSEIALEAINEQQPERIGYTFGGWYKDRDCTEKVDAAITIKNDATTIYAKWTINQYTLSFDSKGGTSVASITQDYGTAVQKPANPTRTGYTFAGWDKTVPAKMPANNVTFNALWTVNSWKVTYSTGGGSDVPQDTRNYGEFVLEPAIPTWDRHTFIRWDYKVGGSGKVSFPFAMPDMDVTLEAVWKENQEAPEAPPATPGVTTIALDEPKNDEEYILVPNGRTPTDDDWANASRLKDDVTEIKFTGLTPHMTYDIYARKYGSDTKMPSPASAKTEVTTLKADQDRPAAPPAVAESPNTVVVAPTLEGAEYVIVPKGEAIPDDAVWTTPIGDGKVVFDNCTHDAEYDVYARMKETDRQKPSEPSDATTVRTLKLKPEVTKAPTAVKGLVYNGKDQGLLTLGTATGGTMVYSLDGATWAESVPVGRNAGPYTMWYKVLGASGYEDTEPTALSTSIGKAAPEATVFPNAALVYSGSAQPLVSDGSAVGGELRHALGTDKETEPASSAFIASTPTGVNAGTYYVWYFVKGDANHLDSKASVVEAVIKRAAISPTVSIDNWTYGKDANAPSVSDNTGNGAVTYTYAVKGSDDYTKTVPFAAGEYTVKAAIGTTDNYDAAEATTDFKILAKALTITADSDTKVYDATALTKDSYSQDGLVEGDTIVSVTITGSQIDAGIGGNVPSAAQIVKGQTDVTASYDISYENGALEVTKKDASIKPDDKSKTYGEDDPTLTADVSGTIGEETLDYTLERGEGESVGTYDIYVMLGENPNYEVTVNEGTFEIVQLEAKLAWKDTSLAYDGKGHVPTATVSNLVSGDKCSVTVVGDKVAVGTYAAEATELGNANYKLPAEATHEFKIVPREAKLAWKDTSFTYDGKGHVPTATVSNPVPGDTCVVTVTGEQANAGTHTATATKLSNANYKLPASATQQFTIARASIAKAKVTLAKTSYTCNGKERKPAVKSVVLGGRTLKAETDYTVAYKSNVNPGTATVTVTGKGNYKDSAKATFQIELAKAKLTTVGYVRTSTMDARWGKVAGAKSYELQWRKVGGKWKTVSTKGTSTTVKNLKIGKLYQLRVRAVAGKQRGAWSNASLRFFRSVRGIKVESGKSKGSVKATWKIDKAATGGYKVFVYAKKSGKAVAVQQVKAGVTSATVMGLKSGAKYYVRVRPFLDKSGTTYAGVISGSYEVKAK